MKKNDAVVAATAALEAAQQDLVKARATVRELDEKVAALQSELNSARFKADEDLPRAVIVTIGWRSGRRTSECEVVIVKRSEKTVSVRIPGTEATRQFRANERGEWRPYPRPSRNHFASDGQVLEFTKDAA